jgi:hypothetical protein
MYERYQNNAISLAQWSLVFDCDHLSKVRLAGQKKANISSMSNKALREEEYPKTELRCMDCHRFKTYFRRENMKAKPVLSKAEAKESALMKECQKCWKKKKILRFVTHCNITGDLRKYDTCNACRKKAKKHPKLLAREKKEFLEQHKGMKLAYV